MINENNDNNDDNNSNNNGVTTNTYLYVSNICCDLYKLCSWHNTND